MKSIFGCLILLGFLLLLGTAGASDINSIDRPSTMLQVSISACMIGSGSIGIRFIENKSASGTANTESAKRK